MSSKIVRGNLADQAAGVSWQPVDPNSAGGPGFAPVGDTSGYGALLADPSRQAQLQAEFLRREQQAREAGVREGEDAAARRLRAPIEEAMKRVAHSIEELTGVRRRLRNEAEEDLVRLAIAIARRVLRRELATDPDAILGLVKAALARVDARELFRVRVHPDGARLLEQYFASLGPPARLELVADRNLEPGAIILETTRGNLDASVETQLQEIERGFTDLVRRRQ